MRIANILPILLVVLLGLPACGDKSLDAADDAAAADDDGQGDAALADLADDATPLAEDATAVADVAPDAGLPDVAPDDAAAGTDGAAGTDAAADAAPDSAVDAAPDVAVPLGCGGAVAPGTKATTIGFGGKTRSYLVHVPKGYSGSKPTAVVFALHGLSDSAGKMESMTGFDSLADKEGFLVVYPEGLTDFTGGSWNAGNCCGAAKSASSDDVGFILSVLADLNAHFCTDPKRVFATGFSNGAYMAQRLACEKADVFAAIAPVSGEINMKTCTPSRAISVLEFHGTSDAVVPYGGGGMTGGAWSVDETFGFWRDNAICAEPKAAAMYKKGDTTCTGFSLCEDGAVVELCSIDKGGHQWPSSPAGANPFLGKMSTDIDATAAIWQFFLDHPMP